MKEDILGVAIVHELCRICAKEMNEQIVMNQKLTEKNAAEIKSMHNKAIGYSEEPCDECKELMTKGFILIEYDEALTTEKNNPYRTGNMWVITGESGFEVAERIGVDKDTIAIGYSLIDIKTAQNLGLSIK